MNKITTLFLLIFGIALSADAQIINSIAGTTDTAGYNGDYIPATSAQLGTAVGIAVAPSGNIYFAEASTHRIRRIGTDDIIYPVAGTGIEGFSGDGGPATAAQISEPFGMAIDHKGNIFFVDKGNICVRKISPDGIISTYAGTPDSTGYTGDGGPATSAKFSEIYYLSVDNIGNLYISDDWNHAIRKVDTFGIITTYYLGPDRMGSMAMDNAGNLYIPLLYSTGVLKVGSSGIVDTIGIGMATTEGVLAKDARISSDFVVTDHEGNIYFTDGAHIRRIGTDGRIYSLVGNTMFSMTHGDGGSALMANISPLGFTLDQHGNILLTDYNMNHIRKVTWSTGLANLSDISSDINVYPIPSNGDLHIASPSLSSEETHIVVSSMSGATVAEAFLPPGHLGQLHLQMADGVYLISGYTAGQMWHKNIVIVH